MDGFQKSHIDYCHEKSNTEGVAMRGENGGLSIFFQWNMGGLERSKAGLVGVFYNNSKKLSCVIFWYYV